MTRLEALLRWGHHLLTGHPFYEREPGRCWHCERDRGQRRIGGGAW
ncbi:MAG: hypothetical protein KF809_15025 [Chloroflexi bacterium]|nr:hypothetical protein [Chloroflexota bacterium]